MTQHDSPEDPTVKSDRVSLVQHIPSWMPGAGFKRHAMLVRGHIRAWVDTGYDMVMSAIVSTVFFLYGTTLMVGLPP